jgi:hypothetical protein
MMPPEFRRDVCLKALGFLAVSVATCPAAPVTYNGTPMTADVDETGVVIRYDEPPPNLREIGVQKGTALVSGKWNGSVFVGEAFVFAQGCPAMAYPVRGNVDISGALTIIGQSPTTTTDCIPGAFQWTENSVMRFEPKRGAERSVERPAKKPKPKPKPKVKPKPRVRQQIQRPQQIPQPQYQPQQQWQQQWQWR